MRPKWVRQVDNSVYFRVRFSELRGNVWFGGLDKISAKVTWREAPQSAAALLIDATFNRRWKPPARIFESANREYTVPEDTGELCSPGQPRAAVPAGSCRD